ncbi:hypothetical protein QJS66_11990 [Kocuria rhizophila]|nr:hypothetical protein QJS66_11990 [Kocuria rhizophila]
MTNSRAAAARTSTRPGRGDEVVDAVLEGAPGWSSRDASWRPGWCRGPRGRARARRAAEDARPGTPAVQRRAAKAEQAWHGAAPGPVAAQSSSWAAPAPTPPGERGGRGRGVQDFRRAVGARVPLYAFELVSTRSKQAANVRTLRAGDEGRP